MVNTRACGTPTATVDRAGHVDVAEKKVDAPGPGRLEELHRPSRVVRRQNNKPDVVKSLDDPQSDQTSSLTISTGGAPENFAREAIVVRRSDWSNARHARLHEFHDSNTELFAP
jgi:hypothetical protein